MSLRSLRGLTDDQEALVGFLDVLRDAVVRKMDGLSDEGMRAGLVDSGTTLGGIVKHLVDVERFWFHSSFAGRDIEFRWTDDDPDGDWRVEDDETLDALLVGYRAAWEESNRIVAAAGSLDDIVADGWNEEWGPPPNLRWILIHMVEETARHAGHADILREQLDGETGW